MAEDDGRQVALGVCLDAGRVLLLRRAGPPWPGWWSLPGGKREKGEGLATTCRRELREELGLPAEVLGLRLLVAQRGLPPDSAAGGQWLFALFACRVPDGDLPGDAAWFPVERALAELRLLPTDRAFLRDVLADSGWGCFRRSVARWDGPAPEVVEYA